MELVAADHSDGSEEELVSLMERADDDGPTCGSLYAEYARTPAEEVLAQHKRNQFALNALFIEATLSERFDGMAFYCDIISETFGLLLGDLADIEAALDRAELSGEELRQLHQLVDLDLEAIDVLAIASGQFCE